MSSAVAQPHATLEQDAIGFGSLEAVFDSDLSPDGSHAVFVGAGPGRTTMVHVADIASGTTKPILYAKGSPDALRWCEFVSNTRLVCRYTAMIASQGGYAPVGVPIPISRTISLGIDGKDIKSLGQQSSAYDLGLRQYDGEIIDWLPDGGSDVLMTRLFLPEGHRDNPSNAQRTKNGVGVVKLNVETLAATIVEAPRDSVSHWLSDGSGHVRVLGIWEVSGETYDTGRVKYLYRMPNSRDWRTLAGYVDLKDFQPLGIDGSSNSLYAVRRYQGSLGLTRIALDGSLSETLVAHDPRFNVDGIAHLGESHRVVGYGYKEEPNRTFYFDPEYKALSAALTSALPHQPVVTFTSESEDRNKVILFAGRSDDPGRYYLFDKTRKSLGELVPVRPDLAGRTFGQVQSIAFAASDGSMITAQLTLHPGKNPKSLPLVIFAGDSQPLDAGGFDWLTQFLVARGYAVIEPHYRGFNGGDQWFYANGFEGWRTAVGDISAAANYVVSKGIADRSRVAIIGWKHGGLNALLAAETEPTFYKATVAIAPITDLAAYKADWYDYTAGKRIAKFVGHAEIDGSAVRRADAIQSPVLLFHGTLDPGVRITQSRLMRNALQASKKESELVEFQGLDNEFRDGTARATMLLKIGQLLDRTIGH